MRFLHNPLINIYTEYHGQAFPVFFPHRLPPPPLEKWTGG